MNVFDISSQKAAPVEQKSFQLEKDIQRIIEPNVDIIFGLSLVRSEFQVGKYRIDSLCYNQETEILP